LPVNYSKEKEKSKAWSANRKLGRKTAQLKTYAVLISFKNFIVIYEKVA